SPPSAWRQGQAAAERQLHVVLAEVRRMVPRDVPALLEPRECLDDVAPPRGPAADVVCEEALRLLARAEAQHETHRHGFGFADAGKSAAMRGEMLQGAWAIAKQLEERQHPLFEQLAHCLDR